MRTLRAVMGCMSATAVWAKETPLARKGQPEMENRVSIDVIGC